MNAIRARQLRGNIRQAKAPAPPHPHPDCALVGQAVSPARHFLRWFILLAALPCALAQSNFGSITGMVTDPGHAAVAGAAITIRNANTGIDRRMTTESSGGFTITNLVPGTYDLSVEMAGFRTYRKTGIVVTVAQEVRSDVTLEIGAVTDSVTVNSQVEALNTENGMSKGDVIVQGELQDLPLNGRDYTDLAYLVPGAMENARNAPGGGNFDFGGGRNDTTNFYVDGISNRDARAGGAQVSPNLDSIQEFKVETSGFSAEYGKMAGGTINVALRGGTNQLHGGLFEYIRNNVINAKGYFDPRLVQLNRNQFGASLGGPIALPKIYNGRNRTFFFFSWESLRQRSGSSQLGRVPTAEERNGDFSKTLVSGRPITVKDPLTAAGTQFPGNVIPSNRFSPVAVKLLAYMPLPNRGDALNNYVGTSSSTTAWDSYMGKIDHRFSEKDTMSFRLLRRYDNGDTPFAGSVIPIFDNIPIAGSTVAGADYTHLFTPTFLMEARAGLSRVNNETDCIFQGQNIAAQLGINGTTQDPKLVDFPKITILNYVALGCNPNQPVGWVVMDLQSSLKFTWIKAKHNMKWGFNESRTQYRQPYFNNTNGTLAVQQAWSGYSMGDFLLGFLNSSSRNAQPTLSYVRELAMGFYFADDWKISPSLTLNVGLRYEYDPLASELYGRMSNFIPGINKLVVSRPESVPGLADLAKSTGLTNLIASAKDLGLPGNLVYPDRNNFAPRLGFAWRPFGAQKTSVRGGYGIFYTGHLLNTFRGNLMGGFPFVLSQTFQRLTTQADALTLANPFPGGRLAPPGSTNSSGYQVDARTGYLQSYNVTVERNLGHDVVLEAGYVGSKGTHLSRQYDVNQPTRSLASYQANGTFARPVKELAQINNFRFGTNSFYSAGQFSLRKRGRGGMFYRLNYTYSKSIDDASSFNGSSDGGFTGTQDPNNLRGERGRSDWDRGHVVTGAFSYMLPFGKGRPVLGSAKGVANALIGGWQLSGSANFATGSPITIATAGVNQDIGQALRPNRLASGELPDQPGRRGVDYPWFDPNAFEAVPACSTPATCRPSPHGFLSFAFGNSGRGILDGPGYAFVDMSMMKNFRFHESKNIQFRFESFNITNHPNFFIPDKMFNSATAGLIDTARSNGRGGSRIMQAALKFTF